MRKRRVLALLLALSLVVSGNGMTVLAEELGADMPPSTSQEVTQETGDTSGKGEDIPGNSEVSSETEDKSEEGKEPSKEEKPSDENKDPEKPSDENKDPEKPSDENKDPEKPSDENKDQVNPGESDPSVPKEDDAEQGDAKPGTEEQKPTVSANDTDADTDAEETAEAKPYVSRMVTFSDDTGMRVTYDANASQMYDYVVADGVLTAVNVKDTAQAVSFEGNVELKQPEEGEKYTSIAANVFGGNQDITYVKLPAGVTAVAANGFKGCTKLKSVYLPSTVNTIEAGAFENCTAMTQISVPKSVTAIGSSAFKNDTRLHLVYIKDVDYAELRTIGDSAFEGCTVLSEFCTDTGFAMPNKIETIGSAAFKGCKAIKSVDFTNTKLQTMGESAFEGCTGLTDLTIGNALALIPQRAFADCKELENVTFSDKGGNRQTIGEYAFSGCYRLKQLVLPQCVGAVKNNAFHKCTNLTRVEIEDRYIVLEKDAFPVENKDLVIIAAANSNGEDYAKEHGKAPDKEQFYTYKVEDVKGSVAAEGKLTGGQIWAAAKHESTYASNINDSNNKQGVKSDDTKYYICYVPATGYALVTESLKCNGKPLERENGAYYFTMPEGGAVITAEFRQSGTLDQITGQKVAVEFSAGVPLRNGEQDEYGYRGVELKLGQTTRLYVLDEDGGTVPASKLKLTSTNTKVATVDSRGIITAVGTGNAQTASAEIKVEVVGGDGRKIVFQRTVSVRAAEAKSIILKPSDYKESQMKVEERENGIKTSSIKKNVVKDTDYKFTLRANVYDGEDAIGKQLTWTSSDTKIVTVSSKTTEAKNPTNVVTVKKKCEGEATITVTATNAAGAEKAKVVQKFVVRVYQEGYKLSSSTVTVNPLQTNGGIIELLSIGGMDISDATIKLRGQNAEASTPFSAVAVEQNGENGSNSCKKFYIRPDVSTLRNGTYKVQVSVNETENADNWLPLTITVRNTTPAPAISFNTGRTKFNLFYKDGRNTADGEAPVVTTKVTRLGDVGIRDVKLEALSTKEDDRLFTENFEIDDARSDFASGIVVIKRTEGNLRYTSRNQPAITGNLVIYYDGYEDSAAKRMRVTMPTCTLAPTYALTETTATYCRDIDEQNETLVLYDRKSKTKEQVKLGDKDHVTASSDKIVGVDGDITIAADGTIPLSFVPDNGRIQLTLRNDDWDLDNKGQPRTLVFNFQVRVSLLKPTVKIDQRSVALNLRCPETETKFTLSGNQKGLKIEDTQTFTPVVTRANEGEISKLEVKYENGVGTAKIKAGETVKRGNYSFKCTPETNYADTLRDVTLTVSVVDNQPTVRLGRGALQLNKAAFSAVTSIDEDPTGADREVSEIPFTVSGKPEGYSLLPVGAGEENTKIVCTTRGKEDAAKDFVFRVKEGATENTLAVSLDTKNLQATTYRFTMTPKYRKEGAATLLEAKPVTFNVKVYDNGDIKLRVAARGRINLVDRWSAEKTDKNGIVYTPTLVNLKGQIEEVKIYDGRNLKQESAYFDISMITAGKDAGRFIVTPKPDGKIEYNKNYSVTIWAKVEGYSGKPNYNNGVVTDAINIRAMQTLPRVTTDKTMINTYLSTKNYNASFVVTPQAGSVGKIRSVAFGAKDDKAKESFELKQEQRPDGSMKVTVHLKEGVEYPGGSTNAVKMYVTYEGQGEKTPETASSFSMKIKVN